MPHQNMIFMEQRMYEIGSALMYCFDSNNNKLATTIIYALKVSDGNLYAIIQQQECRFFEKNMSFATELKFYKKGKPFYLDVLGQAVFLENVDELNLLLYGNKNEGLQNKENAVLVKVAIEHIQYHEWKQSSNWSIPVWWNNMHKKILGIIAIPALRERVMGLLRKYAH